MAIALLAGSLLFLEYNTSLLQSQRLAEIAAEAGYGVGPGASDSVKFPSSGPYDLRLGYSRVPEFVDRLADDGYTIKSQARFSDSLLYLTSWGLFPIYKEKNQAGLRILDRRHEAMRASMFPERVYEDFDAIPPVVVDSLLFIENRELLDPGHRRRNPAIEWDRLAKSAFAYGLDFLEFGRPVPGGSTLATQMEKFRHSPGGVTATPTDKLRQMATASLRAYLSGGDTSATREQLVADYLSSVSFAAVPGHGEVIGMPAALSMWYDADVDEVNRLLTDYRPAGYDPYMEARGYAYRRSLALLLAVKRPSYYLIENRDALNARIDRYLPLLAHEGVISEKLRDAALSVTLDFRDEIPEVPADLPSARATAPRALPAVLEKRREAAAPVRNSLLDLLEVRDYYELDRLDLTVETSVDARLHEAVSQALAGLTEPHGAHLAGLHGHRLLEDSDPSNVVYTFSLYERTPGANLLRVQTDTASGAFDSNDGLMLDLGSTAKLRTLVTYLDAVAELHGLLYGLGPEELATFEIDPADTLSLWARSQFESRPETSIDELLDAALSREYSADPNEKFFTGGGVHRFGNFSEDDDDKVMSVRHAFRHSVNLVFVRLMRDIVRHYTFRYPGPSEILADASHPGRQAYLERFADKEGRIFIRRYYNRYRSKSGEQVLDLLAGRTRLTPKRLAVILRTLQPHAPYEAYAEALRQRLPHWKLNERVKKEIFEDYPPGLFRLPDLAHLARLDSLELWTATTLLREPDTQLSTLVDSSAAERLAAYEWLMRTSNKTAQDRRIGTIMEIDAFEDIHRDWKKYGYPFESLVASYATALGSSADRPSALAELMGIVANDGLRLPTRRIEKLHFAASTPYETVVSADPADGVQVMEPAVARMLKSVLVDTVEAGTGRRVAGTLKSADGSTLIIGGKTGTGDHVYKTVDAEGRVTNSRAVSRSATFTFLAGDRYYGVVSAYVKGPEAADYTFTSSLATHVFKLLAPQLNRLLDDGIPGSAFSKAEKRPATTPRS